MPTKKIVYTPRFAKNFKKLPDRELKEVKIREKLFKKDPFHHKLRTHKLKGKLKNYWSFSISHSYRIVFRTTKKGEILFVDIGTHEIYR
jgi:addiction module RelE/StbE family toxin